MTDVQIATEPIVVKVDPNLKRLYHAAIKLLAAASAAGAVAWHRKYECVAGIIGHTPPLYMAGGFATDEAFFRKILQESRQSALRNLKVARLATPADVARFTPSRIGLAVSYVEAKTKAPVQGRSTVDFDKLKIQFNQGGKVVTKSILTITRPEFVEAIAQLNGQTKAPKQSPVAKAAVAIVKDAGVKGVEAAATKTGLVLRVPYEALAAIGRALADFKVPSS